jgi:hypothetical protein
MQRLLIILGILLLLAGLLWPFISRLPVGRLPGDIIIERPGFRLYIPITTMILISGLLSFIFWIAGKFR